MHDVPRPPSRRRSPGRLARPMLRHLRNAADAAASICGLARLCRRAAAGGVTVLTYHRVLPDEQSPAYPLRNLVVAQGVFRAQVRWLAAHCHVLTLREAMLQARPPGDRPIVCISFDDGYADNHAVAAPILERAGVRATFFVTTGFISGSPMWFDVAATAWESTPHAAVVRAVARAAPRHAPAAARVAGLDAWLALLKIACTPGERAAILARLCGRGSAVSPLGPLFAPMTIDQIRSLHRRGHEIGSHTVTHPLPHELDDEALRRELSGSRRQLELWIGAPVPGFCYPNGDHDDRIVRAVADAGYRYACTTRSGRNDPRAHPLRLRRRFITTSNTTGLAQRHSPAVFAAQVLGLHDAMARCSPSRLRRHLLIPLPGLAAPGPRPVPTPASTPYPSLTLRAETPGVHPTERRDPDLASAPAHT